MTLPAADLLFDALFEQSLHGVVLGRGDGRVLRANAVACAALGATEEDLVRVGRDGFVVQDDLWRAMFADGKQRERVGGVLHLCRLDGTQLTADFVISILRPPGLEPLTLVSFHPVTDREGDLAAVLRMSLDAFWVVDRTGRFLEVNEAACEMLGYERTELLRLRVSDVDVDDGPADVAARIQALRAVGRIRFETRHRRKDGAIVDVEISAQPSSVTDGAVAAFVRDISERARAQRAEEALRATERRLELAVRAGQIGLWDYDVRSDVSWRTPRHDAIFGYAEPQADWSYAQLLEHIEPADHEMVQRAFGDAFAGGLLHFECRSRRVDGASGWIEVFGEVFRDAEGRPARMAGAVLDVTARHEAARAAAQRKDELAAILRTALDAFWIIDLEGRLLEVNDAACAMLGYARDELLAMRVADLEAAMTPAQILEQIQRILRQGSTRFESKHRHRDGRVLDVEISAQPLVYGETRVVLFARDITAKREAEEQLRQAQKMEAVGRLAGGIAHDFNNLLTVMLVGSGFAMDEAPAGGRLREELEAVRAAAQKAQVLTQQLLAFGRQQVLDPRIIDLNEIVLDAESILVRLLGEQITVRTELASQLGQVRADPGQIQQVLMNLVINARDAMPSGGTITVRTTNVTRPCDAASCGGPSGSCVLLSVEDTGVGMDERTKARIFEPFFTTKPLGKGTGLGLSTVFGIVAQSHGSIRVDSEPGRGARFEVCFPRHDPPAATRATTPAPASRPRSSPAASGATVLVVEDDPQVRRIVIRALGRAGFEVVSSGSYDEALAALAAHPRAPDVLLTDVRMPGESGPTISRELGRRFPGLRTVFMSGYSGEDVAEVGDLPADGLFVQKPFTIDGLVSKVREALAG